ncbi:MAG: putative phosphoribosyltransferase [Candidatus Methanohalarchaeum thermophilum]|uniref:Phosphoribosyltransferase n=1 Tax=Methanohalarchaeum thermophilum TaxID=1903181 RepID=A0A1Q6DU88_METT1|nr:MAG: putative phosphoribosyltransferase [Candidatus Methanohalarchaeum thermophilum]
MNLDRAEAGLKLTRKIVDLEKSDLIVLSIPKGGVEFGLSLSDSLNAEFSLLIAKRIDSIFIDIPSLGAVAEDGSKLVFGHDGLTRSRFEEIIKDHVVEVNRRRKKLRPKLLPKLEGRTVVLVDDVAVTGSTLLVSVKMLRKLNVGEIIVASMYVSKDIFKIVNERVENFIALNILKDIEETKKIHREMDEVSEEEILAMI